MSQSINGTAIGNPWQKISKQNPMRRVEFLNKNFHTNYFCMEWLYENILHTEINQITIYIIRMGCKDN